MKITTSTKSVCTGCQQPFRLNTGSLRVLMREPGNGARGRARTEARTVATSVTELPGWFEWICPLCGVTERERKEPR